MSTKAKTKPTAADRNARLEALDRVQAIIEFELDGTILYANENFLAVTGYSEDEIVGEHHGIFCPEGMTETDEYREHWNRLAQGEFIAGEFHRVAKDGSDIWIQASYNPILDSAGIPRKVIKFATDVTAAKQQAADHAGQVAAISRSQAVIEFEPDGTIITANDNFLAAVGYSLDEIRGKHHRMFCDPGFAATHAYEQFWKQLGQGTFDAGEFKRYGRDGKEIWIQASYNPIFDTSGQVFKVVKYASDITARKLEAADHAGQLQAISDSQAVIEFKPDGTILTANDNFLSTVGYTMEDIRGKHHRMFCGAETTGSPEYASFWKRLADGEFFSGEFKRVARGGREVWIQATYNPIRDMNGKVFKVVKFASDITAAKLRSADFEGQINAISKSQAVIEFEPDGTIITANDNFLGAVGYKLDEIRGKHHKIFCERELVESQEYVDFWKELASGKFFVDEFKRLRKDGSVIWIQASYNPIFDMSGKVFKVVKYATDITGRKEAVAVTRRSLERLSEGHLNCRIEAELEGEFRELRDALNGTVERLDGMVGEILESADSVSDGAAEIAKGSTSLSDRAQRQAAMIEETSATVEQLTQTVRQNADNARDADGAAASTRELAVKGGEVVKKAVESMAVIGDSSKKIQDIIGVIDEIAFQTNLLALNAAVEAARAGEQGRGFAVVASEVRNLAGRSSEAAKDIKSLIKDAVQNVQEGTSLVGASGETLGEIVESVTKVTDMVSEIARACEEQSLGISQINEAITDMDAVVQQNANLVESTARSSHDMESQAGNLNRLMKFFVRS